MSPTQVERNLRKAVQYMNEHLTPAGKATACRRLFQEDVAMDEGEVYRDPNCTLPYCPVHKGQDEDPPIFCLIGLPIPDEDLELHHGESQLNPRTHAKVFVKHSRIDAMYKHWDRACRELGKDRAKAIVKEELERPCADTASQS